MTEKTNIVLIGFMGSGKSKTTRELVSRCKVKSCSIDEMISEQEGMVISTIFEKKGEAYFRDVEKEMVKRVSSQGNTIIDCGGGVAVNSENMRNLRKNGAIFYLKASPECLYKNIKLSQNRPLLKVDDPLARIKELLIIREAHYLRADYIIDADFKSISEIADQIESIVKL